MGVAITVRSLQRAVSWLTYRGALEKKELSPLAVGRTDAAGIKNGALSNACRLLVIPGGRDLPFCGELNGLGNQRIRDFVRSGGSYLGICAGGYYGSSRVEFAKGDPLLEVVGSRELSFFPGTARGPVHPGFQYGSHAGAQACSVRLQPAARSLLEEVDSVADVAELSAASFAVYYNGGGHFASADNSSGNSSNVNVLATYEPMSDQTNHRECVSNKLDIPYDTGVDPSHKLVEPNTVPRSAIVSSRYGRGKVVLTGVHVETSAASLAEHYPGDGYIEPLLDELAAAESTRCTVFGAVMCHLLK